MTTVQMKKWIGNDFESSSYKTPEFMSFARDFKSTVKKLVGSEWELVNMNSGHFYMSGFLKNKADGRLVYMSISDVRHFSDSWYSNILIRTAQHEKDYTGGSNNYSTLEKLLENINKLK